MRFFTGVDEPVAWALRLVRKRHREGGRTAVFGPASVLARLDQALWSEPPLDFVPHLRLRAGDAVPVDASLTPVWLLEQPMAELACDSAVNLGFDDVEALSGFERVAEVVATESAARAAGQQRWRRYKAQGVTIHHHPQGNSHEA
ncbi:DNA polymerase III subunit chi [Ideonella sp. 4Y11]|uniref:DNA polymerase III subunit chi n=1 Tax=Ideonella aquatica TaxID=2824119 RepID=A0A941BJE4_9BURK|nr:DNA polymerase III subunit chi [Ideonella aquatica]MBQ0958783.1 DNA polymerase III subunit chi [Ideonella aquatica]